ncbi:hypothetical protein CAEBREN_04020 [Caenorhabditis brenneri]|uniref:Uncharacterized protein n=1 Tax=Caenorhabditis brenneri TaxID=135651 RepID=G0NMY5_CAEBE|nr:hypothetical protein CAEBREN_04020 [Caenorhabditis brenneri]
MILSIFILLVASNLIQAQIPPCPNGVIVFDISINQPVFSYPNGFSKTVEPPLFPLNYTCEYQINVPPELYAKIELFLDTNSTGNVAPVTVIDQLNRTEEVSYANFEAFFFIASGGNIKLSTGNSFVKFGFIVKRYQFETLPVAYQFNVSQADTQPKVLYVTPSSNIPYQAMAETRVSVMVQPLRPNTEVLRALVVFDGPSWNSSSLGTGMQLYKSGSQYVSTGSYMTIMYLDQDFDNAYFALVVQDYELTKGLVQIQQRNGIEHQRSVTYTLDGSLGPSALFSINTDVLMRLEGSGQLEAYLGTITKDKSNMVASYSANGSSLYLPQEFLGKIKTYVLTGGVANLTFSPNQEDFKTTNSKERKGFISSYEYGTFGNYMDVSKEIYAPNKTLSKFKFNFSTLDLRGNNSLIVQGVVDEEVVTFEMYNSSNWESSSTLTEVHSKRLIVLYQTMNMSSNGFFMNFEIEKIGKSCSMFDLWTVFIFSFYAVSLNKF